MLQKCLSYFLVTLIALQSVLAIADTHSTHENSAAHIEFQVEPSLDLDAQLTFDEGSLSCDHCCHCHNLAHTFLSAAAVSMMSVDHQIKFSNLSQSYPSNLSSPSFRPPIF